MLNRPKLSNLAISFESVFSQVLTWKAWKIPDTRVSGIGGVTDRQAGTQADRIGNTHAYTYTHIHIHTYTFTHIHIHTSGTIH